MRLNELERRLEKVAGFTSPSTRLEQYQTPAPLAARLLYHAALKGDIGGRRVGDLGCGTGILAIGAALIGAREVVGVDADETVLSIARENAERSGVEVTFLPGRIGDPGVSSSIGPCDTVVMNPPFGAQNVHADRPFIDTSLEIAPRVYGIFNAGSRQFVESYIAERGCVEEVIGGLLSIRRTFSFHTRDVREIAVEIMVISRKVA
ncbi:MAG: methyltransferase [Methanomicrobiales archaeon]|nr:methyltransferase [Methanomicrobiales archaeon]